jgi:hypothetical protein
MVMKCPHCLVSFFETWESHEITRDNEGIWRLEYCYCANCEKIIIKLKNIRPGGPGLVGGWKEYMVWPRSIARAPLPKEVPEQFASDYREACLVLSDSPKASAALSRRCLQHLLREVAGVKPSNLADEIEEVMKSLPSHLAKAIDAVRNLGNFAAHPIKSTNTGEIVDVEPGEAEWLLEVLEGLFDFYFVQPAILEKKRQDLNAKLREAGKHGMK